MTSFTSPTELSGHQVTDPDASGSRWFYRVGFEPVAPFTTEPTAGFRD